MPSSQIRFNYWFHCFPSDYKHSRTKQYTSSMPLMLLSFYPITDSPPPHSSSASKCLVSITRNQRSSPLTDFRIPKYKPPIQLVLHPIHLGTNNAKKGLAVNQHFDS